MLPDAMHPRAIIGRKTVIEVFLRPKDISCCETPTAAFHMPSGSLTQVSFVTIDKIAQRTGQFPLVGGSYF